MPRPAAFLVIDDIKALEIKFCFSKNKEKNIPKGSPRFYQLYERANSLVITFLFLWLAYAA